MTAREERAATALRLRTEGEGLSWAAVAREMGISTSYAHELGTQPTAQPRQPRRPLTERQVNEIAWYRRARTLSVRGIAAATGVSVSAVGEHLKGEGEALYELRCEYEYCGDSFVTTTAKARFCKPTCAKAHRERERAAA